MWVAPLRFLGCGSAEVQDEERLSDDGLGQVSLL